MNFKEIHIGKMLKMSVTEGGIEMSPAPARTMSLS